MKLFVHPREAFYMFILFFVENQVLNRTKNFNVASVLMFASTDM
mgnify:CR=1 FL=1